jgi:hypothetical protein
LLGSGVRGWSRPAAGGHPGAAEDLNGDPASPRRGCIRGCPSLAGRALAALQGIFEKAGVSSRGELVAKLFAAHHARSRLDRPERPGTAVV